MPIDSHFDFETDRRHYEALLHLADLLVHHQDLGQLFSELALRLHRLTPSEIVTLSLHDPAKNVMRVHVLNGKSLSPTIDELPVEDAPSGWVWQHQKPLVMSDLDCETRFKKAHSMARYEAILSYCVVPLTTAQRRLGGLGFGSTRRDAYSEKDVQLLQHIAELSALAVENALTRAALRQEKERLQTLLEVNATLLSNRDLRELFPAISGYIRNVVKHEYASIAIYDESVKGLRVHALDPHDLHEQPAPGGIIPLKASAPGQAFLERQTKLYNREQLTEFHHECAELLLQEGVRSACCIPLMTTNGPLGVLSLASREEDAFPPQDVSLLKQVASQVAVAIDNARAYREIAQLRDKLTEEKRYLQGEIRTVLNFEEIIGDSRALTKVLEQAKTVATSDATVLILGETGTGKELIARAVHRMSPRKEGSFIKVNCAAIPTGLLESELFGHEKGAFTGAVSQKIGRLELADKGTLFLDEVGEIALELQPKLLRALQDQEFERLGGTRTIKVNVRLVTATNRDLARGVERREFRSDLYYRLNVFPIRMPALRERREDIPSLVRYFVQKFSRRMNKQIEVIPTEIIQALTHWPWPGNVRELENFMERSVILSNGPSLNAPLAEISCRPATQEEGTLLDVEREHIVRVLRESGGVIAGMHGAAARLGMKRTTLQSMMKRMSISRLEFEN
jgi:formate hydrogenlyase transcriptional activator